ncbi:MAG: hypothetical protein M3Y72_05370 [Acidobacteriota bacterium]|nr:hypothetical protein [Acidobacteriota bacterium]
MKYTALTLTLLAVIHFASAQSFLADYKGSPYTDARHPVGAQPLPGVVQCAFYDSGGEGVAYHDSDAANSGSGTLNPADGSYLNEFRMHEGVDISYTKFRVPSVQIDDNHFDLFQPPPNLLYIGWTVPGEWFNLTVNVAHTGRYAMDLLYTSNKGGSIALDVDGTAAGSPVNIPTTFNAADPIAWRQWHHWNLLRDATTLDLTSGKHVLTVHIVSGGQMNLATFDFKPTH